MTTTLPWKAVLAGIVLCQASLVVPVRADAPSPVTPLQQVKMRLTLDEDFRVWPNPTWSIKVGEGSDGTEEQVYAPSQVLPQPDGGLRLRAERKPMLGRSIASGAISTNGSFSQTYGHFEMKARMPRGNGTWPAFWLLPTAQTWPPEIDIFEFLGRTPASMYFSLHWSTRADHKSKTIEWKSPDPKALVDAYHVYAVDWRPDVMVWSVDGKEVARMTEAIPQEPMYMIANLAIGGVWPGPSDQSTPFPADFDIAYVRVYQFEDVPTVAPSCMEFGKPTIEAVKGDGQTAPSFHVKGTLHIGKAPFELARVKVFLTDVWGKTYLGYQQRDFADLKPGATMPFEFILEKPASTTEPLLVVTFASTAQQCQSYLKNGAFIEPSAFQ